MNAGDLKASKGDLKWLMIQDEDSLGLDELGKGCSLLFWVLHEVQAADVCCIRLCLKCGSAEEGSRRLMGIPPTSWYMGDAINE